MINKTETPTTTKSNILKEKKQKKKEKRAKDTPKAADDNTAKIENTPKAEDENAIKIGEFSEPPSERNAILGFEAIKKITAEKEASNQGKLFDDGERVLLQITGIKLPKDDRRQFLRITLPHCCVPEPRDVCLIVKDLEKGLKIDHEPTLNHFNEALEEKGVDNITQVISLRELKVEYKQYEAKHSLCQKFDIFLVDERILRLVPKFLGKPFYSKKRIPIPVDLTRADLKNEIDKAINTVTLPLSHHGTCSMLQLGNSNMESKKLAENLLHVNTILQKRYPGGWKNIRAEHIKTERSISIPLYTNILPTNDIGFVDADVPKKVKRETVKGELSTIPGVEVTVTPSGDVKVVKTIDPDWDEWDEEKDEAFVDGSDDEHQDESISEKDQTSSDKKTGKRKSKNETNDGKHKKLKKDDDSDSEDEAINKSEQQYMNKRSQQDLEGIANDDKNEKPVQGTDEASEKDLEESSEENDSDDEEKDEDDSPNNDEDCEDDEDEDESGSDDEIEQEQSRISDGSSDNIEESDSDEQFDDRQEIDEEDVIVDDDDEEMDEQEVVSMDKHLLKKVNEKINDEDEVETEVSNKAKVKKRSKKERRNMLKKQKQASKSKPKTSKRK